MNNKKILIEFLIFDKYFLYLKSDKLNSKDRIIIYNLLIKM